MNTAMKTFLRALLDGDTQGAISEARILRDAGVAKRRIIIDGVEEAMTRLDAKCTVEQFNLLEIMLCGRAVMEVIHELYPTGAPPAETKGTLVLCSLEGDVHDLGKNIVKVIASAGGYRVVDRGKDCPLERLLDTAANEAPLAVGLSGLITTIIPQVRLVREALAARGLGRVKIMAGGAALKQASAAYLNVDFVAQTAFDGLHFLDQLTGGA